MAALEWSEERQALVLYGGRGDDGELDDMWEYDGEDWRRIDPPVGPHARSLHGMSYDRGKRRLLVTGGRLEMLFDPSLSDFRAIWLWSGRDWHLSDARVTGLDPPYGVSMELTFDEAHDRTVGYGGGATVSNPPAGDALLYEFTGHPRRWETHADQAPGDYIAPTQGWSYDAWREEVVMFGGRARGPTGSFGTTDETWALSGYAWRRIDADPRPSPREETAMVFDRERGVHWLYGGSGTKDFHLSDLWRFDGERWELVADDNPPGGRRSHAMAFDERRGRVILFGDGTIPRSAHEGVTWEWDGARWIAQPTPVQPETDRVGTRLAWDPDHEVTWLFGGAPYGESERADLWAWGEDPDRDGIVGGLDNCREAVNPDQLDGDADAHGDACDCAPGDAGAFALPSEVTGVRFAADGVTVSWDSAAPAAGSETVHDVLRGPASELPATDAAECLARGVAGTSLEDPERPPAGKAFWYVVRGRNSCGPGPLGGERASGACD